MALERSRDKITKAVFDMEPTAVMEFYRIYPNTVTKPKTYFNVHNGSVFGKGVYWQGEIYNPVPMESEGFSITANGKPNRPIIRISNKDLLITSLLANNEDFRNAKIERKRTFVKYLDDENFDGGNPWGESDPNAEISVDLYFVSQKRQENKVFVELELTNPLDIESRDLTNRKVLSKYCFWNYRGAGCEYQGLPVQREDGKPFTYGLGVGTNGDLTNKEITTTYKDSRDRAKAEQRSFVNMENFGETFIYANPNDLWNPATYYRPGQIVFIYNEKIRIQDDENREIFRPSLTYFVSRKPGRDKNPQNSPDYWEKDGCGKKLFQCKQRFAKYKKDKVFLSNITYEQRMWNIQPYEAGVHQSYLRPIDNSSTLINNTKSLFKYKRQRWGYPHPPGTFKTYEDLYDNFFEINSSTRTNCKATTDNGWTTTSYLDLDKEFTILFDIEYLGPPQRYLYYPPALNGIPEQDITDEDIEAAYEDVDQILLKTSKEKVGYYAGHSQFVIGIQKEPYIEFRSYRQHKSETSCRSRLRRVKLVGGSEEGDYLKIENSQGLPTIPEGGYDVKNSRNFVFSLKRDKFEGKGRFIAKWSCLTYPNDEEKESVYIECQTTLYVDNMITSDCDRIVLFGGNTQMPVNDAAESDITDIDKFTSSPSRYETKWSQQGMQVAMVGIWNKALSNVKLNAMQATQNVSEEGANYETKVVKLYDEIKSADSERDPEDKVLTNCNFFWQEPYKQDGIWYVRDHQNANHLIYKDRDYGFAGGPTSVSYTRSGYDFLDLQSLITRNPNIGKRSTVEGEFGTLHFGGFPGTDGYRFTV